MKILINTPDWRKPYRGGVANHYYGLKDYWKQDVRYNIVGSRGKSGLGVLYLPFDLIRFFFYLVFWKPDLVLLNPSLASNAMRRDSLFLKISALFKTKCVIFFHGFNIDNAENMDSAYFLKLFSKADAFIVLADKFKTYLRTWGIERPIYLSTTKVEDKMLNGFIPESRTGIIDTILVLSRIERQKGVYEALDTYNLLLKSFPNLKLRVVGDGSELADLKEYALKIGLKNVVFTGALAGKKLHDEFVKADLYLFFSYHEGMPTSVLEAMAFGLPVITRPVGGLVDFFESGKMGEMIDSLKATDFVDKIMPYIEDSELSRRTGLYNYSYAKMNFLASRVAGNMEHLFEEIVN